MIVSECNKRVSLHKYSSESRTSLSCSSSQPVDRTTRACPLDAKRDDRTPVRRSHMNEHMAVEESISLTTLGGNTCLKE